MERGNKYKQQLKGKKVLVVGLGKSGKAAARALNEAGAAVYVQDSKTQDKLDTQFIQYMQNEGIKEGVKSAASYRFMAKLANFSTAADLAKERKLLDDPYAVSLWIDPDRKIKDHHNDACWGDLQGFRPRNSRSRQHRQPGSG